jgi:CTP synthase
MMKFIFVTGGVISSLGKGLIASSIGLLMKARGFKVNLVKIDPYLQIDAGTMSPYEHGEVFVTDDGGETDLDIGNYERFLDTNLTAQNSITTGKVYWSVLSKERQGNYLGKTVQVIPHITDEIKGFLLNLGRDCDLTVVEIGGTVGDIESQPFLEAIREMKKDLGKENVLYVHVSLLPYIKTTDELKTKPTQHSVKELRSLGITPDLLFARTEVPLTDKAKEKLSLFCDVEKEAVIEAMDTEYIYEIPVNFELQGLGNLVSDKLSLDRKTPNLEYWNGIIERIKNPQRETTIGIVGKYVELRDAYKSLIEALTHAGIDNNARVKLNWVSAENIEESGCCEILDKERADGKLDAILVPGGFGFRGIEGMIEAVRYAREKNIPFLGLCLGLQCAVIEFARDVCGFKDANSTEFDSSTPYPVIDFLPEQRGITDKGGTMRVGAYPAVLKEESLVNKIYGKREISERHRHRYEVNNQFRDVLEKNGLSVSGVSPDGKLVEFIEIPSHKFFVATQAHPEFKSRPNRPHPLFSSFIKAALENKPKN